jgi:hypothetical protein
VIIFFSSDICSILRYLSDICLDIYLYSDFFLAFSSKCFFEGFSFIDSASRKFMIVILSDVEERNFIISIKEDCTSRMAGSVFFHFELFWVSYSVLEVP